ncbi:hypothetical protein [Massilia consociata]|uniref:Uncharacterized protein n=1 Tax=Massilia consociata TaxID=760117 RepID=A0ABV6FC09_9BURK
MDDYPKQYARMQTALYGESLTDVEEIAGTDDCHGACPGSGDVRLVHMAFFHLRGPRK